MDVSSYFDRIGYGGTAVPSLDTLCALHKAHCYAVPFENLDIHLGRPMAVDPVRAYAKIVDARRGGFCYELNPLFGALLGELGFAVSILEGRVVRNGAQGLSHGHLMLKVDLDEPWLVDVGFGDGSLLPLALDDPNDQVHEGGRFRIEREGGLYRMLSQTLTEGMEPQYAFDLEPRGLSDFAARCQWTQTSPDSGFTQRIICTLPILGGRKGIVGSELWLYKDGIKTVAPLSTAERNALIRDFYGLDLKGARLP